MYALTDRRRGQAGAGDGVDGDPACGGPLPDRAGPERRGTEGGGHGAGHALLEAVPTPISELTRCAGGAEGGDGRARRRSAAEEAAHAQSLLPKMDAVRAAADTLEGVVADDLWPLPTYQEMLYILLTLRRRRVWGLPVLSGTGNPQPPHIVILTNSSSSGRRMRPIPASERSKRTMSRVGEESEDGLLMRLTGLVSQRIKEDVVGQG